MVSIQVSFQHQQYGTLPPQNLKICGSWITLKVKAKFNALFDLFVMRTMWIHLINAYYSVLLLPFLIFTFCQWVAISQMERVV